MGPNNYVPSLVTIRLMDVELLQFEDFDLWPQFGENKNLGPWKIKKIWAQEVKIFWAHMYPLFTNSYVPSLDTIQLTVARVTDIIVSMCKINITSTVYTYCTYCTLQSEGGRYTIVVKQLSSQWLCCQASYDLIAYMVYCKLKIMQFNDYGPFGHCSIKPVAKIIQWPNLHWI